MAKKKSKKNQKAVEWASPPATPKPEAEKPPPVPELPEVPEEASTAEATKGDIPQVPKAPEALAEEVQAPQAPEDEPTEPSSDDTKGYLPAEAPAPAEDTKTEPPAESADEDRIEPELAPKVETAAQPEATPEDAPNEEHPTEPPPAPESQSLDPPEAPEAPEAPTPVEAPEPPSASEPEPVEVEENQPVVEAASDLPTPVPKPSEPEQAPPAPQEPSERSAEPVEATAEKTEPVVLPDASAPPEPTTEAPAEPELVPEPVPEPKQEATVIPEAPKPPSEPRASTPVAKPASPVVEAIEKSIVDPTPQPETYRVPAPPPFPQEISAPSPPAEPIAAPTPLAASPSVATTTWETARSFPSTGSSETSKTFIDIRSPPKPVAVRQVLDEERAPVSAPTPPPVSRPRPRHAPAFDDDDDDNESALIHPRLRNQHQPVSRDSSRGSYPPPPQHNRGPFASRVPSEHIGPQRPPPAGYHPSYYPPGPSAPPYYHGHTMSQSGGYSPYGPPSHGSSPYQDPWGQYPPAYPPYGSPPLTRHESAASREYALTPPNFDDGSAIEDEGGEVFSRIAQAIPDLHVLLAKYKETHGQLSVREELLRRSGVEQQERLRAKDEEIFQMRERMAAVETKHTNEANRLRFEIANMEEQVKELREKAAEVERLKKEVEETRMALEAAKASWETKYRELEESTAEEKRKTQEEFEEWKQSATMKHDAEKIALAIQFDKKLNEADIAAENQRQEAAAAFLKEIEELKSEHQRRQNEWESNLEKVRRELEDKVSAVQKEREETLKHEREARSLWEADREALVKAHKEDREGLARGWNEQRALLEAQYKQKKEESDKAWIELHADANRKATEEKAKVEKLAKEFTELQEKFDKLKAENEREKEVIKSVAGNLESEKARLEKLMECYGDIAEIKSKGDTYYLVSFSQLQKQIMDLAATHFVHLPVTPPHDVLEKIPPELPSFLGNTFASRQLRSAYVAHIVSAMVTFRVFGPFLFSLGRRYDKADSLFLSMSHHIRDKSTRKEAIWRQQTLLAAFTSSGAKQRINTAAGTVVDEIVSEIRHFADPREEEGIRIAVRRIVKLAAETWRYARLEREMISATMPAVHDDKHEFSGPDYWPPHKAEETAIASLAGSVLPDEPPKLLLRLFPVIYREPKHENFRSSRDEKGDTGCIYHHGLALYDDAKCVEMRREELRSAGMPSASTASPTAADFPPPIIPPPRNPPPPTPEVEEVEVPAAGAKSATGTSMPPTPPPTEGSRRSPTPSMYSVKSVTTSYRRPAPVSHPSAPSEAERRSPSPAPTLEMLPSTVYVRPVPGPISYANPAGEETASATEDASRDAPQSPSCSHAEERSRSPVPSLKSFKSASKAYDAVFEAGDSIISSPPTRAPPPVPSEHSGAPPAEPENRSSTTYTRPIPIRLDSIAPEDIPLPPTVAASEISAPPTRSPPPPPVEDEEIEHGEISIGAPSELSRPPTRMPPPPLFARSLTSPLPMPRESMIIPPFPPSTATSPRSSIHSTTAVQRSHSPPTPPRSPRAPSPLFAAEDEIEALRPHRKSMSRRSMTSSRPSMDENDMPAPLNPKRPGAETTRRTSGYALSSKPSIDERSLRSEKSTNSRYSCESRSAAIKGLYPNSPLAGADMPPPLSRTQSEGVRSHGSHGLRRKDKMSVAGTWDTNTSFVTEDSWMAGDNHGHGH